MSLIRSLAVALAACLVLAPMAYAGESRPKARPEVLPVWNQANGRVEAVLLLEPLSSQTWQAGNMHLDTALGVDAGNTLGLVCESRTALASAIGNLVDNCRLASLGAPREGRQAGAGATVSRGGMRFGVGFSNTQGSLPTWLVPGTRGSRVNENTLTLIGEKNIGREATVTIGGTVARARLVSPESVPELADRWDVRTLSVGANVGRFGANIIGRVVDSPLQPGSWEGLGLGLSWRTPWRGQLSVGADNVVTRGRNPFAPVTKGDQEGTVPYVRYQQDL
ncbi:MAG: hypothetical protein EPO46_07320 [Lysobacter sp.]|nr:MAG: hypothetical protein EPO46_07320 [Lysobacter sp.]